MATISIVEMGKLHYWQLEVAKILALQELKGDYDKWMPIMVSMHGATVVDE